jgi:diguanylate cyclase
VSTIPPALRLLVLLLAVVVAALVAVLAWQRRALTRARHDATHDDVTAIPNRRAFLEHLQRQLRTGGQTSVVLLDLDRFKEINDTFGHRTGNTVLATVAARLHTLTAQPGVLLAARLSGDEFALLVGGDTEHAAAVGHQAWQAIAQPCDGDPPLQVYASVGHATAVLGGTAEDLLHRADLAMYRAKTGGTQVAAADTRTHDGPLPAGGPMRPRDRRHHR